MTVNELLARIGAAELTEWMAYYNLEPFGDTRADIRSAIVASTVANTARDAKRKPQPFEPREFMPTFKREKGADTNRLLRIAEILNAALGGRDERE